MSYSNVRFANPDNDIINAEGADGISYVIEVGHPDYDDLVAGVYGAVAAATVPVIDNNVKSVTKLAVMRYLKSIGNWEPIRAAIAADVDIQEEWLAASKLDIDDPTVLAMQALLGWTDTQLQDLFNAVG